MVIPNPFSIPAAFFLLATVTFGAAAAPAEAPAPVSRVTGSSGNTETGSLVTYSGGARG